MEFRWSYVRLAVLLSMLVLAADGIAGEQVSSWTQWRGPSRDGRAVSLPSSLSGETLKQQWRVPLGPSYSGPIVTQDRIFVTETKDQAYEVVRALDRGTGKQIWSTQWRGAMRVPFFARANGDWIRATPAFDGQRLYVAGIRDVLVCLDARNGKQLWKLDFVNQLGSKLPSFGCVSSPLIVGDSIVVQAGGSLMKLNKLTGKIIWRSLQDGGGMYGSAFSSPITATLHGRKQLIVQTRSRLAGVDLKTGDEIWSQKVPAFRGMNILTPTVFGDQVFTSSYGGRTFMFKTTPQAENMKVEQSWVNKAQGYMSSPVVIGNYVYLHLRNQRFCCIDLNTGRTRWTSRPFGKYWSMVASGNRILALDERGELLLIKANPAKFELLSRRQVSEDSTWAHLAVCGRQVFVRELNALTVMGWDRQTTNQVAVGAGE